MQSEERREYTNLQRDSVDFLEFAEILFGIKNSTLRQIEKIFAHTRLVLNTFKAKQYIFPSSLLFLTFLYQHDYPLLSRIKERKMNLQEFLDTIESVFINDVNEENRRFILYTVASLLGFYFMYIQEHNYALQLITKSDTDKEAKLTVKSKIDTSENNSTLLRIQEAFQFQSRPSVSIIHLINSISLTEPFIRVNVSKAEE